MQTLQKTSIINTMDSHKKNCEKIAPMKQWMQSEKTKNQYENMMKSTKLTEWGMNTDEKHYGRDTNKNKNKKSSRIK